MRALFFYLIDEFLMNCYREQGGSYISSQLWKKHSFYWLQWLETIDYWLSQ